MNPEFKRYLWLELTVARLVVMPLLLGMLFFIIVKADNGDASGYFALVAFVILVVAWGGKLSADSIIDEVSAHTWDNQRMSSLPPWQMVWGKLFGSSVFAWYGGLFCLAMYLLGNLGRMPLSLLVTLAVVVVLVAITFQAMGLISGLMSMRANQRNRNMGLLILLVLVFGSLIMPQLAGDEMHLYNSRRWHGLEMSQLDFILYSAVSWCGWVLFGAYRMMRSEMQYRNGPFTWLLFLLWITVYFSGLVDGDTATRTERSMQLAVMFSGISLIAYILLLSERMNLIELRKLLYQRSEKDGGFYLDLIPLWLLTLAFVVILTLAAVVILSGDQSLIPGKLAAPIALCFILRDAAATLMLRLSPTNRRGALAALIYLAVVYYIANAIIDVTANGGFVAALFLPNLNGDWLNGLLPALIGAVAMITLAGWRLYRPLLARPST